MSDNTIVIYKNSVKDHPSTGLGVDDVMPDTVPYRVILPYHTLPCYPESRQLLTPRVFYYF